MIQAQLMGVAGSDKDRAIDDEEESVDETLNLSPVFVGTGDQRRPFTAVTSATSAIAHGPFLTGHDTYPEAADEPGAEVHQPTRPTTSPNPRRRQVASLPPVAPPSPAQSEFTLLKQRAYDLEPIPGYPLHYYDAILDDLQRERIQQATLSKFSEGERLNRAINHVIEARSEQAKLDCQRETQDKVRDQQSIVYREIAEYDRETERQHQLITEEYMREREKLESQQQRALDDHVLRWNSAAKRRQYNRASVKLIVQRRMRAVLLQQCRFTDAEQVDGIITNLEAAERVYAQKQMERDYSDSVGKLAIKHQGEIETLDMKVLVQHAQLRRKREIERMILLNREMKLKKREDAAKDKEKLWVQHGGGREKGAPSRAGGSKLTLTATMPNPKALTTIELPLLQKIDPPKRSNNARSFS
jgi:hypothetical protein